MVMKPEPWGAAIDAELGRGGEVLDLIILTPSGSRFNQSKARELAAFKNLVFACGRYEGIDARVAEHYKQVEGVRVHEISIGDYVLNGGEVAALVIIEAITRLIPGVIGNPESLLEESHNEIGEVEYPVYTKPTIWRGLEVPEVLTSGKRACVALNGYGRANKRGIIPTRRPLVRTCAWGFGHYPPRGKDGSRESSRFH
jgi:tRNA (guanine37-N1)-methyltransferase